MARLLAVLMALAAVGSARGHRGNDWIHNVPGPMNLGRYYTNYPQPIPLAEYARAPFKCQGKFALCAYALCVPIPGSNPLVAECGCLEFDMINSGAVGTSAVLNEEVADKTRKECKGHACTSGRLFNKSTFCRRSNAGTMYPGYPLVSTYNSTAWTNYIGETTLPSPAFCQGGGTFADCYTAACRRGPPTSPYLSKTVSGKPLTATCYCPIYTTKQPFLLPMEGPCGPKVAAELTPSTVIINSG